MSSICSLFWMFSGESLPSPVFPTRSPSPKRPVLFAILNPSFRGRYQPQLLVGMISVGKLSPTLDCNQFASSLDSSPSSRLQQKSHCYSKEWNLPFSKTWETAGAEAEEQGVGQATQEDKTLKWVLLAPRTTRSLLEPSQKASTSVLLLSR